MYKENNSKLENDLKKLRSYFYNADLTEDDMINFYGVSQAYYDAKSNYE